MRPGSVDDGTERPPAGMGRISAPWTRQSARPRWTRRAILTSITGHLLWSGPQGAATPLGRFYIRAPSLAARPGGEKSAGRKGAQGWGPQKSQSTVVTADWRVFGVPWRSRVPVLDLCPFARLPGSLLKGHKGIETDSASSPGAAPT